MLANFYLHFIEISPQIIPCTKSGKILTYINIEIDVADHEMVHILSHSKINRKIAQTKFYI